MSVMVPYRQRLWDRGKRESSRCPQNPEKTRVTGAQEAKAGRPKKPHQEVQSGP